MAIYNSCSSSSELAVVAVVMWPQRHLQAVCVTCIMCVSNRSCCLIKYPTHCFIICLPEDTVGIAGPITWCSKWIVCTKSCLLVPTSRHDLVSSCAVAISWLSTIENLTQVFPAPPAVNSWASTWCISSPESSLWPRHRFCRIKNYDFLVAGISSHSQLELIPSWAGDVSISQRRIRGEFTLSFHSVVN